jgi:hypothetical protein
LVSVKDFGAVGDGVTDDTAAIQAAGTASNSLYFPKGTYKVNFSEASPLIQYANTDRIRIIGSDALIYDTRNYSVQSATPVFEFSA